MKSFCDPQPPRDNTATFVHYKREYLWEIHLNGRPARRVFTRTDNPKVALLAFYTEFPSWSAAYPACRGWEFTAHAVTP